MTLLFFRTDLQRQKNGGQDSGFVILFDFSSIMPKFAQEDGDHLRFFFSATKFLITENTITFFNNPLI